MGAFEYQALDATGRTRKGVLEGDTARQVRQSLREQGLTPLAVEEVAVREGRRRSAVFTRGVNATDLALITRQLATLVRSGLPLEETLHTVARQSEKPRLRNMMMAVRSKVLEGHTVAEGLGEFPQVFPELYRATVAAGEHSGHLDVVLERLADYTEARQMLRQKIQLALFYPAILTFMALAVTVALLTYVVPQVVQVFDNIGQELPWLTRALIAASDFMRAWGIALAAVLGVAGWLSARLLRRPEYKLRWHRLLHRLPLIGRLTRGVNTARFARTFSILSASGVPVLDAMRISAQVLGSLPMREAVEHAAHRVREGASIHHALEHSGYFPAMTLQLIASGEASGQLDAMLERAAANQERELETTIAYLMGLFEPLLIVTMGAIVMVIVLAILLPIFDLNQLVK
ncbi:MAG: type II secretion system protein GspF [Gammaproteobacteria bacterium HGW-Gammaproteobacteria-1]|jgi:general secretion pathway protein F|nr:MAG: type II secretion system protein GspF [Gammaproteobacteria bacterium HGW-Gammaproteobacteria-1]